MINTNKVTQALRKNAMNISISSIEKRCEALEESFLVIENEMETHFIDHLTTGEKYSQSKEELWNFVKGLGYLFPELYRYFPMQLVQSYSLIDLL